MLDIDGVNQEIGKYEEKKDIEKRIWIIQQQLELEKALPQKTNLMVGRTEIPKWSGQSYEIWKNEIERWVLNDKSSDETKYCNVLESIKKNEAVRSMQWARLWREQKD